MNAKNRLVSASFIMIYFDLQPQLNYETNKPDLPDNISCDFIIVGGGTGGLALASRLAEVKDWSVCVIEKGPQEDSTDFKSWTCGWGKPADFTNPHDPNAFSTPQLATDVKGSGRLIFTPRFEGAGGTSRIYGAIVRRPSPAILANWPETWDLESMMPYYKSVESHYCYTQSYEESGISMDDCRKYHGSEGPMPVNVLDESLFAEFSREFTDICADKSAPWGGRVADYNGPIDTRQGCSIFQQFTHIVDASSTARGSSFSGYLKNNFNPPDNLHLLLSAPVTKIIFEGTRAVGVHYLTASGDTRILKANKEVIISAGAYETPHLLQVSGVGDPALLDSLGIKTVATNVEVGKNLCTFVNI